MSQETYRTRHRQIQNALGVWSREEGASTLAYGGGG